LNNQYRDTIKQGQEYYEKGEFEKALEVFKAATSLRPDLPLAHYMEGRSLEALQKFNEAIVAYNKALIIEPTFYEALVCRAHAKINGPVSQKRGLSEAEKRDAFNDFGKAIRIRPNDYWAYHEMGMVFQLLNEFEKSWHAFEKAMEKNAHDDPETYVRAGMSLGFWAEKQTCEDKCRRKDALYRAIALCSMSDIIPSNHQLVTLGRNLTEYFSTVLRNVEEIT